MNRKRVLAVLLSGVMVTGLLTACGGNSSGGGTNESAAPAADNSEAAADSGAETEPAADAADSGDKPFSGQSITFADTGAGDWEVSLDPIVEKFEAETGATVNVELYSHADYLEMLQVRLEAGSDDYDVIGIDVPLVASYAVKDWVVPVDEYFSEEEKQQFSPSALEAGSWDGKFYAPAMNSSSQLLL